MSVEQVHPTTQVELWARKAGYKLDVAFIKSGPDHKVVWIAGAFGKGRLSLRGGTSNLMVFFI